MTQKDAVNYSQNYLSAVGSLSGSQSAYGTFDQNGGVWEVLSNNKSQNQLYIPLRGGGWTSLASLLQSVYWLGVVTDSEAVNAGFRIVRPPTSSNLNPESPSAVPARKDDAAAADQAGPALSPYNSAKPPTPRCGGKNTQPPTGSGSPGSTWGTSKGRPTAKASATPIAGSWITTAAGNGTDAG